MSNAKWSDVESRVLENHVSDRGDIRYSLLAPVEVVNTLSATLAAGSGSPTPTNVQRVRASA